MHETLILTVLIFCAALLYSSVGHGGASGYLAAMALLDVPQQTMKPAALALNILVSAVTAGQFIRARAFCWSIFWPLAAASTPLAFFGGYFNPPGYIYRPIVGVVLLVAAARLAWNTAARPLRPMPIALALAVGASVGLLSGLAGVGGGIFLTPILLFAGWAEPRQAAGISAAFIFVNSVGGMAGYLVQHGHLPEGLEASIGLWAVAALAGGVIGSSVGSRRLGNLAIRRLLAIVLVIAAFKFLFT